MLTTTNDNNVSPMTRLKAKFTVKLVEFKVVIKLILIFTHLSDEFARLTGPCLK